MEVISEEKNEYIKTHHSLDEKVIPKPFSLRTHWFEKNTYFLKEKERNARYALLHW